MDLKQTSTDELVSMFAEAASDYHDYSERNDPESPESQRRLDILTSISVEINNRPPNEILQLRRALSDPRQWVQIQASQILLDVCPDDLRAAYLKILENPESLGVRISAKLWLDRINGAPTLEDQRRLGEL